MDKISSALSDSIYLVGGAVRDALLDTPTQDRDWVVVGCTPNQLLDLGFQQVGADFPVFLHPETQEEYALARTERKSGQGYLGFECDSSPNISLEEDLRRRDLTINAMARSSSGQLIDPYNGRSDLENRVLRHVSEAFLEDPLRVLRVARFAARFSELGFEIAPETQVLMSEMCESGELRHLASERIWQETNRALLETSPVTYFRTLKESGALAELFQELNDLFGIPQPKEHHPEIDCGVHALLSLEQACHLSDEADVRFAALIHDLGKACTPQELLPAHHGHEKKGLKPIKTLCKRINTPKQYSALALIVSEFHTHVHRASELRSETVLKVLKKCDAFRRPERFEKFLLCCEADAKGRTGLEHKAYPQANYFRSALLTAKAVNTRDIAAKTGLQGKALGDEIDRVRSEAILQLKEETLND